MGWHYHRDGITKQALRLERTTGGTSTEEMYHDGTQWQTRPRSSTWRCLAAAIGTEYTLWTVWEVSSIKGVERYIGCDLMAYDMGGYKAMSESVHPRYYSCPLAFLDMVPVASQAWRDKVYALATDDAQEEGA